MNLRGAVSAQRHAAFEAPCGVWLWQPRARAVAVRRLRRGSFAVFSCAGLFGCFGWFHYNSYVWLTGLGDRLRRRFFCYGRSSSSMQALAAAGFLTLVGFRRGFLRSHVALPFRPWAWKRTRDYTGQQPGVQPACGRPSEAPFWGREFRVTGLPPGGFPAWGAMLGHHRGVDAAAHVELRCQPHETRRRWSLPAGRGSRWSRPRGKQPRLRNDQIYSFSDLSSMHCWSATYSSFSVAKSGWPVFGQRQVNSGIVMRMV